MKIMKTVNALLLSFGLLFLSPVFANSILSPLTDSVNSGIINTKMAADHSLTNINVDATVTNGMAIFSGEVHSKAQQDELISIAHSVSGIQGVDVSKLRITGSPRK